MRLKPKPYGPVTVLSRGDDTLWFATGDEGADPTPHPPIASPVDSLLAALGGCLVKSLFVAAGRSATLPPFSITLTAQGAVDLPGRLASIDASLTGRLMPNPEDEAGLLLRAKAICTVSNSLSAKVSLHKA